MTLTPKVKPKSDIEEYCEKYEKHKEVINANIKYSIDRFDILIISLSSGGLVFSLSFVKELLPLKIFDFSLIKLSWVFLIAAIVSNLFSQVSSYYANDFEIKRCNNLIRIKKGKTERGKLKNQVRFVSIFNKTTLILNGGSIVFLVTAIILLVIFMNITI